MLVAYPYLLCLQQSLRKPPAKPCARSIASQTRTTQVPKRRFYSLELKVQVSKHARSLARPSLP